MDDRVTASNSWPQEKPRYSGRHLEMCPSLQASLGTTTPVTWNLISPLNIPELFQRGESMSKLWGTWQNDLMGSQVWTCSRRSISPWENVALRREGSQPPFTTSAHWRHLKPHLNIGEFPMRPSKANSSTLHWSPFTLAYSRFLTYSHQAFCSAHSIKSAVIRRGCRIHMNPSALCPHLNLTSL